MAEADSEAYTRLKNFVKTVPRDAGVYIMRDAKNLIIYVGKAKSLRNRLSSYFSGAKDVKTTTLLRRVRTIEYIIAANEYEALLLENNLIKEHKPRYNINLKDGKTYPVIRITNEEFPVVFRTRRIIDDGSSYFGPFPGVETIDRYLNLIDRLFPLRKCRGVLRKRKTPCLYYHMGRCSAPCAGLITADEYREHVERVKSLLSGDTEGLKAELASKMASASTELRFERAAQLRDAIQAIDTFRSEHETIDFDEASRDYVAYAVEGTLCTFVVFQMRTGKMVGRDLYRTNVFASDEEALQDFLFMYYTQDRPPPPAVYVPVGFDLDVISDYFRNELKVPSSFQAPEARSHAAIMNMAAQNAKEDIVRRQRETGDVPALQELQKALGLAVLPARIEGFDIAQLSGKFPVASLVSFRNGVPDKKNYRYFRLRTLGGKIDDFESMREAVGRRYTRLANEGGEFPDLILIDGGIGQVNAAKGILDALELSIPVIGLAKRDEEIWLPRASGPISLPKSSPALHVLQRVRDETHRFATGLNQRLRSGVLALESLVAIPGIGEVRARRLIEGFGSVESIAEAEVAYIAEKAGIPEDLAREVKETLTGREPGPSETRSGTKGATSAATESEPGPSAEVGTPEEKAGTSAVRPVPGKTKAPRRGRPS
jgi:excinuclease ABC subunit C